AYDRRAHRSESLRVHADRRGGGALLLLAERQRRLAAVPSSSGLRRTLREQVSQALQEGACLPQGATRRPGRVDFASHHWHARHPVGSVPLALASDLRDTLDIRHAIETGTYKAEGARALASIFESVATIEMSARYYQD